MNDSLLWTYFKTGSKDAFSNIYRNYYQALFLYGSRLTPDTDSVKDSIQDLFLDLWIRRARLGETTSIKYYLFKCLKRRIVKTVLRPELIGLKHNLKLAESPAEEIPAEEKITNDKIHLQQTMDKLTRRQREAIYLKFYSNLDTKNIASAMSLSTKGASNLVSKGIVALRSNLKVA